jgi:predicted TIM-barrel fold metal-dependent hydrolase
MPIFDTHTYLEGHVLPGFNQNSTQIAQAMQARGIDRSIVIASRAIHADPLSGNRILKAMLDQSPVLYGCLTAHLNRVDASVEAIRDLLGHRKFVGILLTSIDPTAPLQPLVADEVLNACRRFQKPIFITTPNAQCVEVGLHLAKTYNMHKFIFLGMGGLQWRTAIAAAHQSVNIFLETSGPLDRNKLKAAVEALGPHRVMFGSGMPRMDPAAAMGLLNDSGIAAGELRRILFDNAAKLFNLAQLEQAGG